MKILIATGGTGGHIFPAIETAKTLKARGHKVSFAGCLGQAADKISALDFPCVSFFAHGLVDRSFLGWMRFGRVMAQAIFRSFGLIRQLSPDKIIGFGGYGAFPVVMAGVLMGRPVVIHEQNVVPGKANALLAKMAHKVAISFEASRQYFSPSKAVWTGCPCHQQAEVVRLEGIKAMGLDENKKTIMLLGGSQGSKRLNEVFFELMQELSASGFQAIHMTGQADFALYEKRYRQLNLPVKTCAFINHMDQAYAASDMVVSRSGAASVTELGLLGIAAVLVPYPFAAGHQKFNAQVLADRKAAIIIEQKDLTKASLKEALMGLWASNPSRENILNKTKGLFQKDAALQLALVIEGL
ncbi:MAG: undecaprenyldiphospho-muramoylpentapeptide beta-N-acetylglucosaminyltransferase [Candidatus Omnitrophica bacterium]|nr:undecaprenyldiphospho-muramoylpentapeptide beta-N-acetylglucosaminyltransferase [Candidatus Omnitrophota bacterium]